MASRNQKTNRSVVTDSPAFAEVLTARYGRRGVLRGVAGVGALGATTAFTGFLAPSFAGSPDSAEASPAQRLNFEAVPRSAADRVVVADGHEATPFIPWGTPICGDYPAYRDGGRNSGAEQEQQTGMHHDGMAYFPVEAGDSRHGLLCVNHEYIDVAILHPEGPTVVDRKRTVADEVRKEVAAHGVSVVEIARNDKGDWDVVRGRYNRRITGATPMALTGPVRGADLVKTKYSPEGTNARGTIANCANGQTAWGTYLTCEENWSGYFFNGDEEQPREQTRYGVPKVFGRHGWGTVDAVDAFSRFNAGQRGETASDDYRNEPNTFGWVVEIDPFDPDSTPKKRTAMGRFAHESAELAPVADGEPAVVYMGDDSRFEHIYKFVSDRPYRAGGDNSDLLESGTLYVARFNADGSGDWLALSFGENDLTPENGFANQAEILVNTRAAAELVGATPMDRPEWAAVHPVSREVYVTLTNNTARETPNAANPRSPAPYGHIIRWRENGAQQAARFDWDIFALAGPAEDSALYAGGTGTALDETNMFSSPDGLWFDPAGVLWIQTDGNDTGGNDMLLAAIPETGELRRFLTGVKGAEVTGLAGTPDRRTLFCNIQHPGANDPNGSQFPDGPGHRPRSATLVITRGDGGTVGSDARENADKNATPNPSRPA